MYELNFTQIIRRPRPEVFAFFSDIENLERITPPWLHFKILTSLPFNIEAGSIIDYRLKLSGMPFHWQTKIEEFQPNDFFTDTQAKGPYRYWQHLHRFTDIEGGTLMEDRIQYRLWGGPLSRPVNWLFVNRSLQNVFAYRQQTLDTLLPPSGPPPNHEADLA